MTASRAILTASALLLGVLGVGLLFAPAELGGPLGLVVPQAGATPPGGSGGGTVGLELVGGALAAFAVLDWTARGALYGGIYGRPIALGNFLLGFVSVTILLRQAHSAAGWVLGGLFVLHAAAWAWILFRARPWDGSGA